MFSKSSPNPRPESVVSYWSTESNFRNETTHVPKSVWSHERDKSNEYNLRPFQREGCPVNTINLLCNKVSDLLISGNEETLCFSTDIGNAQKT